MRRFTIDSATNQQKMVNQRHISVDANCYYLTKFGCQKAVVNRKYGHDTQGVMKPRFWICGDQSAALNLRVCLQRATVAVSE